MQKFLFRIIRYFHSDVIIATLFVGRIPNHIATPRVTTFIFYGFSLGLFGAVNRVGQLLIILVIWSIQIAFSSWWLRRFQYGPLEWV